MKSKNITIPKLSPRDLGSREFLHDYGLRYPYVSGAMFRGISSPEMVIKMGKAGFMGFFGAGGLGMDQVEQAIVEIKQALSEQKASWGMNLLHSPTDASQEENTVALYLKHGVRFVEAAGFLRITAPLVHFRFHGAHRDQQNKVIIPNHLMAKVSRSEIAQAFFEPPPERLLKKLLQEGKLTVEEVEIAHHTPVCDALCVEADSGGHTDGGNATVMISSFKRLRDEMVIRHGYKKMIHLGAAGGIGTPESAMSAFLLGADFIGTGSINQCTPESGTSDVVKNLLASMEIKDRTYAPAGDMFELGARVQVMTKGTLFPSRGNKLYQLYRQHASLEEIDSQTRQSLESFFFKQTFEEVWEETERYFLSRNQQSEIDKANQNPKHKMALVFRWYFAFSIRLAIQGVPGESSNYQIHSGPAMGAFNQLVRGTDLEDWQNRHVDRIAHFLLSETAKLLTQKLDAFIHLR